jgi:hypothetical protein
MDVRSVMDVLHVHSAAHGSLAPPLRQKCTYKPTETESGNFKNVGYGSLSPTTYIPSHYFIPSGEFIRLVASDFLSFIMYETYMNLTFSKIPA